VQTLRLVQRNFHFGRDTETRAFLRDVLFSCGYSVIEAVKDEHAQAAIDELQAGPNLMVACSDSDQ
jgi:hypothetical protein